MNAIHNVVLRHFLTASTEEAMENFAELPHAVRGDGFVYVPGKRDFMKRLLLVGHADTVRAQALAARNLKCRDNVFSASDGPLGADDRAGLAMLWILAGENREHSILVTDGEEAGGTGAREAVESLLGELLQHTFCVEVDRKGCEEMVFYDGTANEKFRAWLLEHFPKWEQGVGSFTDIAVVCKATLICGVNFAAGYRGEHTKGETLTYGDWLKTLRALQPILELAEYPDFGMPDEREPQKVFAFKHNYNYAWEQRWNDTEDRWWWEKEDGEEPNMPVGKLALLDVCEKTMEWLPVLNAAGDVVDYADPALVSEEAREEGFVEQAELMEDEAS